MSGWEIATIVVLSLAIGAGIGLLFFLLYVANNFWR